jgi:PAS domain S-box-containing protein
MHEFPNVETELDFDIVQFGTYSLAVNADRDTEPQNNEYSPTDDLYASLLQGQVPGTDALVASQQMLQMLMDSMTNAVFWKDLNSRYIGVNKVLAKFAGVEPSILVGKSDLDMPWADSSRYGAEYFIDWDREVIESGEPRLGLLEQIRSVTGEYRWIETNKVPLLDLEGNVIGILGTFTDVNERVTAEEELKRTLSELDERVQRRTTDLVRANESLKREVEDRVRLQAEERQQRAYAEALRDTAAAMSRSYDLQEVTEQVLVGVERLVSNDLTAIVLMDDDGGYEVSRYRVAFGYNPQDMTMTSGALAGLSVLRILADEPGPIILDDPELTFGDAGSVLGACMRVGDQILGYLVVESAISGVFAEGHADRLGAVADQAGAAISNSRLASRASEIAAVEERQRLARDFHDAVNQTLWAAVLTAESLLADVPEESDLRHRVERLTQLTRGGLAEMRSLLLELRPDDLAQIELDQLIEHLLTALECRRTLDVTVELETVALEPEVHLTFYRVAQECLSNIAQHSEATSLAVRLTAGETTELCVSDNGIGFDVADIPAGHLGVSIMQERADLVGAKLDVVSEPGQGTTIRLWTEAV